MSIPIAGLTSRDVHLAAVVRLKLAYSTHGNGRSFARGEIRVKQCTLSSFRRISGGYNVYENNTSFLAGGWLLFRGMVPNETCLPSRERFTRLERSHVTGF